MPEDISEAAVLTRQDRLEAAILRRDLEARRVQAFVAAVGARLDGLERATADLATAWRALAQQLVTLEEVAAAERAARREEYEALQAWRAAVTREPAPPGDADG